MATVDYPSALPGPELREEPKVRARNAGLPGRLGYTAPERDYYGTLSVNFFFDREQAAIFKAWWDTNQGYWFNAVWPSLAQSLSVYRLLGAPTFNHVYDGAYKVSAKVELRGASLAVVEPLSDPFFGSVLFLLEPSLDALGSTTPIERKFGLAVTESYAIVSAAAGPFGGNSIELLHTGVQGVAAGLSYAHGSPSMPGATPMCFEGWFYTRSYSASYSQSLMMFHASTGALHNSQANHPLGRFVPLSYNTAVSATLNIWAHYAVIRDATRTYAFLNGSKVLDVAAFGAAVTGPVAWRVGSLQLPANISGYRPHNGLCGGVRMTYGTTRYSVEGFTPPSAPFPTR